MEKEKNQHVDEKDRTKPVFVRDEKQAGIHYDNASVAFSQYLSDGDKSLLFNAKAEILQAMGHAPKNKKISILNNAINKELERL